MLKINLTKQAKKFLQKLPNKQARQIIERLLALKENTKPFDYKKLHGYDMYRIDVGEYRIIYFWNDTTVFVKLVGKRNDDDVYRKLNRL